MEECTLDTANMEWKTLDQFPGKVDAKILREEEGRGAKTMLVRLGSNSEIVPHSHIGVVQHFVLEGSYESDGKTFEQHAYRCLPSHADVSPISTKGGATILMIYDPITS